MTLPLAYEPTQDQMYQILYKYENQPYDHLDYAVDRKEKDYLLNEYRLAYANTGNYKLKVIKLPKKYHPKGDK